MNNNSVIKVENVSKKFCKSLKRSMTYGLVDMGRNMLGLSSHPYRLRKDEFWAVKDVSFEVRHGEALGIIGPNGSGKTTFLKMLNGIFWPDKGKISVSGRVGALIAVGAGFHPMFTGRENIYINGAILGMSRQEISDNFDRIVEFAGVGDFIDTPVKYYSSGMFVRLGFAIAVFCNPDVLLIDEVLAVGDMAFQAKCLNKIKDFVDEGKTIVFISHQMHQVEKLCDRVILLFNGESAFEGDPNRGIDIYRTKTLTQAKGHKRRGTGEVLITDIELINAKGELAQEFEVGESVTFRVHYSAKGRIANPVFSVGIFSHGGMILSHMTTHADDIALGAIEGKGYMDLKIRNLNLLPHSYAYNATIVKDGGFAIYDEIYADTPFTVRGGHKVYGVCHFEHKWQLGDAQADKKKDRECISINPWRENGL